VVCHGRYVSFRINYKKYALNYAGLLQFTKLLHNKCENKMNMFAQNKLVPVTEEQVNGIDVLFC